MTALDEFLAGERPDDVAIYLADDHLRNAAALADHAERVEGGYVLVLDGERARRVFPTVAGDAPMEFAQEATKREGSVDRRLTGGACPAVGDDKVAECNTNVDAKGDATSDADGDTEHAVRFVLAFAEERAADDGGLYEEGDVIHAYVRCSCGATYSDRWVVAGESSE